MRVTHNALLHDDGNRRGSSQHALSLFLGNLINEAFAGLKSLDCLAVEIVAGYILIVVRLAGGI